MRGVCVGRRRWGRVFGENRREGERVMWDNGGRGRFRF